MQKKQLEIEYNNNISIINLPQSYKDLLNQINNKFPTLNTSFEIYYENKKKINTKILNKKEYEIFINNSNTLRIKIIEKNEDFNISNNIISNNELQKDKKSQKIPINQDDLLLSYLVEFSNNLFKLDYDSCNNMISNQRIYSLLNLMKSNVLELKILLEDKLIKILKIFINSMKYYTNLEIYNLAECLKKLQLYQIKNDYYEDIFNDNYIESPIQFNRNNNINNRNFPFSQENNSLKHNRNNKLTNSMIDMKKNLNTFSDNVINTNKSKNSSPEIDTNNVITKNYSSTNICIYQNDNNTKILNQKNFSDSYLIMEQNIYIINSIIKSMNIIGEAIGKIQDLYSHLNKDQEEHFNEDIFINVIEFLELNLSKMKSRLYNYENKIFVKNTFLAFLSIPIEDCKILLSLFKYYKAILSVDVIEMMNCKIIIHENFKKIKARNKMLLFLKLYIFLFQFKLDNDYKSELIFKTYFDKKKNNLIGKLNFLNGNNMSLNNNNDKNNNLTKYNNQIKPNQLNLTYKKIRKNSDVDVSENNTLKDLIFSAKPNLVNPKILIEKLFEEKIDIKFVSFIFQIKSFYENNKKNKHNFIYERNNYGKFLFIEQNEEYGIINFLHIEEALNESIIGEIEKAMLIQKEKEGKKSFSSNLNQNEYFKVKVLNELTFFLYKISNFLNICIQYNEKSISEFTIIKEMCKNFKVKFSDFHIFKTTI